MDEQMKPKRKARGGGITAKLRDDLREERLNYPRARLSHPIKHYLSEGMAKRPLYGLHALARVTELMLYHVTRGANRNPLHLADCECAFVEVRRVIRNHMVTTVKNRREERIHTDRLRGEVRRLVEEVRRLYYRTKGAGLHRCPCCHGRGRIPVDEVDVLKKAIRDLVNEGLLSKDAFSAPIEVSLAPTEK